MADYSGIYFGGGEYYATSRTLPLSDEEITYKEQLIKTVFKDKGHVKICLLCGRYFATDKWRFQLCSKDCSDRRDHNNRRIRRKSEKYVKWHQDYRETHKEQKVKSDKEYRKANKEKISKSKTQYYHENSEKIKEYNRKWYAKNRDSKKFFEAMAMADAILNYDVDK